MKLHMSSIEVKQNSTCHWSSDLFIIESNFFSWTTITSAPSNITAMARKKIASRRTRGKAPGKELTTKAAWKTETTEDSASKGNKNRSGFGAQKEIRKYQKSKNLLIQKKSFVRLLREIAKNCPWSAFNSAREWDFKPEAMKALQFACEDFLIELDEDSYQCVIHANRVTLLQNDLHLAVKLHRDEKRCARTWSGPIEQKLHA